MTPLRRRLRQPASWSSGCRLSGSVAAIGLRAHDRLLGLREQQVRSLGGSSCNDDGDTGAGVPQAKIRFRTGSPDRTHDLARDAARQTARRARPADAFRLRPVGAARTSRFMAGNQRAQPARPAASLRAPQARSYPHPSSRRECNRIEPSKRQRARARLTRAEELDEWSDDDRHGNCQKCIDGQRIVKVTSDRDERRRRPHLGSRGAAAMSSDRCWLPIDRDLELHDRSTRAARATSAFNFIKPPCARKHAKLSGLSVSLFVSVISVRAARGQRNPRHMRRSPEGRYLHLGTSTLICN